MLLRDQNMGYDSILKYMIYIYTVCMYVYIYIDIVTPKNTFPTGGCYKHPIPGLTINNME